MACCAICPSDHKFPPRCLLILIELPATQKFIPAKKKFQNWATLPAKTLVTTNWTICELWQFSKIQKWKQSSDWYGQDDRTPIHYVPPPSSSSRRCFKKSSDHHFCDHLKIVILSFDVCWLLKNMQGATEIKPFATSTYLRNTLEFWKMAKNVFDQLAEELLWLNFFLLGGQNGMRL